MAAAGAAVSVVVPCYRCAATVVRAVESALAQSLPPLEIILVDDASPDDTPAALRRLRERDPSRVTILTLAQNRGPSGARNAGWDAARGDYVAFLDADDSWHPRKLEIQLEVMRQDPDAALSGHRHRLGALPDAVAQPAVRRVSAEELLWSNRFVTPSAMVRRDVPQRFEESRRHMEDHLLWLRIAYSGAGVLLIDAPLAAIHKPIFGARGQSAELLAMERAELQNYRLLWREGRYGAPKLAVLWLWSALKFVRRLAIVAARRLAA